MRKPKYLWMMMIAAILWLAGCNKYEKLLKSDNNELKRTKALEYYEKKDYYRALGLFEDILPIMRLGPKGEEIYYKYCFCHYYEKDYYLAGYYFKSFARTYPGSDKVEECLFLSALCNVKLSPAYYLDQSDTKNAIRDLQVFLNRFPESGRVDTCNKLIDKLQLKLDTKEYQNAYLYLKTEHYKSAVVAFQAELAANPGTPFREKIMYNLVEAGYKFGKYSVTDKKLARLQEAMGFYTKFVAAYPESRYRKDAEAFNEKAKHEYEKVKREIEESKKLKNK